MKKISAIILTFLIGCFSASAQTEVETHLEKSSRFRSEQKFPEAVAEITKAINLQPNNYNLYLERAVLHYAAQNKPELLADVQTAIRLAPANKKTLYEGTLLVFRSGQYQQSSRLINDLLALGAPDLPTLELNISIKTHLEDFAGAHQDLLKAIELYPNENRLKNNLANSLRLIGDSDAALNGFSAQIAAYEIKLNKNEIKEAKDSTERDKLTRELAYTLLSRAKIYEGKNEIEKMKLDLIRLIEVQPISHNYVQRANFYMKQKMFGEALADINRAMGDDSEQAHLIMRRADIHFAMRNYSEALKDCEFVVKAKQGLEHIAEKRIAQIKLKMQESNLPIK